jgi:23S rRNA (uracil1939-C5)-methyltransferase
VTEKIRKDIIIRDKLRKGDIVEIEVHNLAPTGKSVGRFEGMVVMADFGVPGDTIECEITEVKRRFAFAKMLRVVTPSDRRIEPRCRHFGRCGGCNWQAISYDDQLKFKVEFVQAALQRIGKLEHVAIDEPVAAAEPFFYRNKMEYSFGSDEQRPAAGLHVKGRYDQVFDLEECYLQSERSVAALKLIRSKAHELGISFMDERTGSGELRFLVVREGKLTGDFMLNLVTFNREFEGKDALFKAIVDETEGLTSLFHTVNSRKANIAVGDEVNVVFGEEFLTETIGRLEFKITPFSFFQTNSRQTQNLYDVIVEHAELSEQSRVLDLFCGCGTIGMYLADRVKSVVGVEINEDSIEMAKHNAELNGITNTEFFAGDVRRKLVELAENNEQFDLVVTDPPRAGMDSKAIRRLVRLRPQRIVAVSCNPATFARDLAEFQRLGYRTTRVTPVDMFPQTAHVEAVATLVPDPEFREPESEESGPKPTQNDSSES